jgi:spermidine synthase
LNLKKLLSYFWEQHIETATSEYSGELTVQWQYGRKVLHSPDANYSFDTLHRVMQKGLSRNSISRDGKILILGMGAGSAIHIIRNELNLPNPITAVEIDPAVVDLAEKHFEINSYDNLDIHCTDAVKFISETVETFDWMICDLFIDRSVPKTIWNVNFIENALRVLTTDGLFYINVMRDDMNSKSGKELIRALQQKYDLSVQPIGKANYAIYIQP